MRVVPDKQGRIAIPEDLREQLCEFHRECGGVVEDDVAREVDERC